MSNVFDTLKWKALIALGLLLMAALPLSYAIVYSSILPRFLEIERREARTDLERIFLALDQEIETLRAFSFDWSAWDDTYRFMSDRNQGYIDSNLVSATFIDNDLTLVGYLDAEGRPVWGQLWDPDLEVRRDPAVLPDGWDSLVADSPRPQSPDDAIGGLLHTPLGLLVIAATPIVTSENEGPMRGTLFMGRLITPVFLARLSDRVRIPFTAVPVVPAAGGEPSAAGDRAAIGPLAAPEFVALSSDRLQVGATYAGIDGTPLLNIRAVVGRHISSVGRDTAQVAFLAFLIAGAVLLAGAWYLVRRAIITPLDRIGRAARHIGDTGDLCCRLAMMRRDEIGALAEAFDTMSDRLAEARQQIASQAFKEGMVEIASGVVHTIRNALTPLTLQLDHMQAALRGLGEIATEQRRVLSALAEPDTEAERRDKLRAYFQMLESDAEAHRTTMCATLASFHRQMTDIEDLLSRQASLRQNDALVVDHVKVVSAIERALQTVRMRQSQPVAVEIDQALNALPPVRYSPMGLELIFANILENAFESVLAQTARADGRIEISGRTETDERLARDVAHIRIRDNGEGIRPDHLTKVFERGFTTRQHPGRGYGLHWCANMIQSMGGRIAVDSQGPNQGAVISVMIPVV